MTPESNIPEVKAVHNYSIQTGEEFALEFMRDRVNPTAPVACNSNTASGLNYATGYLELKGILGISNMGSESGSDVSMVSIVDKSAKELRRRPSSLYEDKVKCDSLRSVSLTASGRDLSGEAAHGYASFGASNHSVTKMKLLFSYGGKIMPRPSDGKLRYVGGETRVVCLNRDISWKELMYKASKIYDQVSIVKYQLPGEDLDALVSVTCDEDLQNMMEECNSTVSGEGSKRFRIFLFSMSDLDDVNYSLSRTDSDSEVQFVVAVNGMDTGSRKGSGLQGFGMSSSEKINGPDDFDRDEVKHKVEPGLVGLDSFVTSASLAGNSPQLLPTSSSIHDVYSNFYSSQAIHPERANQYLVDYGYKYHHRNVSPDVDNSAFELHAIPTHQVSQDAGILHSGLQQHSPQMQGQEINTKPGLPIQQDNEFGKSPYSKNDYDVQNQVPLHTDNCDSQTSGVVSASEYVNTESDSNDLGCHKPPVPPQRVFYSVGISREQPEPLNRLSKSDDSLGSQLLVSQPHSDLVPKESVMETVNQLHENEVAVESMPPVIPSYAEVVSNGLPHSQNHNVGQANKNFTDDILESAQESMVHTHNDTTGTASDDTVVKLETVIVTNDNTNKITHNGPREEENGHSRGTMIATYRNLDDHKVQLPELSWDEIAASDVVNHNTEGGAQPFAWTESSTTSVANRDSSKPEGGDILIDINDRFPRDFLSDIFSKTLLSEDSFTVSPLHNEGPNLSMNMENHEPKRWSYFQKLAQDVYTQNNMSLIDQDHLSFVPSLTKVEEDLQEAQRSHNVDFRVNSVEDNNFREIPETGDGKGERLLMHNVGLPRNPSLEDIDLSTLQFIKNHDLEEFKELGSGTFGTVYHGKWRGTDVAIKRIKKSCFTGRSSEQERLALEFWREADILSKLHHPNVVAFYGVVQDGPGGTLATVTEYMVDGSLRHVLLRKDKNIDRRKKLIIAMDAAFGMEYLHGKNIVHFDLKCDNLLVNLKDPSRPICKVGDFGLSKIKRNTLVSGGVRGTLPWMAPELLNGSSNKVSEKVDVFSFGIVLWEILTGEEPYANMHYGAIIGGIVNNTLRPTIPSYCDPEWRNLMEQCWAPNPVARPSFSEIADRLRVMSTACQPRHSVQKASK
ncbi:unnamed protein product [Rhodiola kirilowii]